MAMLISRATGNFTSSSTWGVADSATGSQLTNPSASTNTTTSYVYSSTFTGTNTRVADGIALFLKRLNTTGTVTVALSDDNGVTATREVTVNASDLPADESWVFFKFGTTLTLDGGTDYRVGVIASVADNALIYRDATAGNWARMVSTTTTGAPAATDTMLIVGEWTGAGASSSYTVTMDNTTTTDFGGGNTSGTPTQTNPQTFSGIQIGQNGTLTWGTSAATNYYLKLSGNLIAWSGGTYNMGTSGTPCPRNSTMTLELDSTGNSSTVSFGLCAFNGATISIYGLSRTAGKDIVQCKLSADAAANATSLTIDTDTGWLDNDEIGIAATSRTNTEGEFGTLNGAAGASTLTVDGFAGTAGGLAFAHSGTSPTQAEIINLTRNVVIRSSTTTPTGRSSFLVFRNVTSGNIYWCQFLNCTGSVQSFITSTTAITFQYCAFTFVPNWGSGSGIYNYASLNGVISNCVFGRNAGLNVTTHPCTITNNTVIYNTSTTAFTIALFANTVLTGNSVSGASNAFSLAPSQTENTTFGSNSSSSNIAHSNALNGITFSSITGISSNITCTINNFVSWRNNGGGISITTIATLIFNNLTFFGNTLNIGTSATAAILATFNDCLIAGDTSFASTAGINFSQNNAIGGQFTFNNCQFSPTSGIYVPHTTADINLANAGVRPMITLNNTLLGAATEVSNPQNLTISGFVKSSKHDQTEGAFKSWFQSGVIERDTTIFNTAAPSERLTPTSATIKLASGPRLVAVDDGNTITINAYVRKSAIGDGAAYNGNQPRLIVRANLACGITTDTVLDTMTVGTGTWEQLTGTTAAVDADGALEFYVDCDGTAGWINVDDWTVT